jgi:hypothetical protein
VYDVEDVGDDDRAIRAETGRLSNRYKLCLECTWLQARGVHSVRLDLDHTSVLCDKIQAPGPPRCHRILAPGGHLAL